jgi:DnaJ homolog subfamily C member 19
MARLIILLAVIGAGLLIWHKISQASGERRRNLVFWTVTGLILGTLVVLVITGRMHWLYAIGGAIAAFAPRVIRWIKYLPILARFHQQYRQQRSSQGSAGGKSQNRQSAGKMSTAQAYEVLGLKPGASRDEIIHAHRRMMQKVHPDRGGSDYLASQINQAKDTLLG